jgi:hypothetical protein
MKSKVREGECTDRMCLELKYCERCGGLWLRPVGGGQIYCATCARGMAELPPAWHEAESEEMPPRARRGRYGNERDRDGEGEDLEARGVWRE